MNQNDYVRLSLELHLFFDRIMKEHSFFLETAFTEKDNNLKRIAWDFQKNFSIILTRVINLANNNVSQDFLSSNEMITTNTFEAERKTSNLSGVEIDTNITRQQQQLRSGITNANEQLANSISTINRNTLPPIFIKISYDIFFISKVIYAEQTL